MDTMCLRHMSTYVSCFLVALHSALVSGTSVRISEPMRNVNIDQGGKAKFICKVDVHPLDQGKLLVSWKFKDHLLKKPSDSTGRYTYKKEGNRYALIIRNAKPKDTGVYTCIARVGLVPEMTSAFLQIKIGRFTHYNTDATKEASDSTGRYTYEKEVNRYALIIRNAKPKDTGVYTCIARVGLVPEMTSAFLQIKSVPDPPINVKVTSCHGNNAGLSWEASRDNGAEIVSYIVQFNTTDNPSVWYNNDEEFGSHTRMVTLQLYPWGTYSFRVISKNTIGSSKPSIATSRMCTTPPDRPDRNPSNIRTSTHKKKHLVISWTPMSRLDFHGPRFRYRVKWRMKGTFRWHMKMVFSPEQGSVEVETNDVYRLYEITVRAENSMGQAHQPTFLYTGRSGESEPLISPSNFTLNPDYQIDSHTAHFIWDTVPNDPDLICGKMKGYKLRYWKASEDLNRTKEVEIIVGNDVIGQGQTIKVALSDLPAFTTLKAQVAVMNSHHTGPFSDELDFFTPEGIPSPVTNLRLQSYGFAYVLIKWHSPVFPNGVIQGYDVAYQQVVGVQLGKVRPLDPHINDSSILGARITGLRPGRHYRFLVWARTKKYRGDPSFIDVMTAKGEPPHAPRMRISKADNSAVNITWPADHSTMKMKYLLEYRHAGQSRWHNGQYVVDKSWVMLDQPLPVSDLEVRLVASNRLGDTATSKTVAVANSLKKAERKAPPAYKYVTTAKNPNGSGVSRGHHPSSLVFILVVAGNLLASLLPSSLSPSLLLARGSLC